MRRVNETSTFGSQRLSTDWVELRELLHPGGGLPCELKFEPLRPHLRRALINLHLTSEARTVLWERLFAVRPKNTAALAAELGMPEHRLVELERAVVGQLERSLLAVLKGPHATLPSEPPFPSSAQERAKEYRRLTEPESTRVLSTPELQTSLVDLFDASMGTSRAETSALWNESLHVLAASNGPLRAPDDFSTPARDQSGVETLRRLLSPSALAKLDAAPETQLREWATEWWKLGDLSGMADTESTPQLRRAALLGALLLAWLRAGGAPIRSPHLHQAPVPAADALGGSSTLDLALIIEHVRRHGPLSLP